MPLEDKDIEAGALPPSPPPKIPERAYQVPEWETSSQGPKPSLFSRLASRLKPAPLPAVTGAGAGAAVTAATSAPSTATTSSPSRSDTDIDSPAYHSDPEKDKAFEAIGLPHHATSLRTGTALPAAAITTTSAEALRARFDRLLPPHRKYLGRSRRFFLLTVVLPLCVVFLFVLPLALGLGLRGKHSSGGGSGSSSGDSSGGGTALPLPSDTSTVYTGDITYYQPALGACGWENSSEDAIVAVSKIIWDKVQVGGNPNNNPLCGKKIRVRRQMENVGWRSVDVTVVDRCVGCAAQDLDLTLGMFVNLAAEELGRVTAEWAWLD